MTEVPPVAVTPSGPQKPLQSTPAITTPEVAAGNEDGNSEIRCVCGFTDDDGYTIQCDQCLTWQHIVCMGIHSEAEVPDNYQCAICKPRHVDVEKARRHQQRRKDEEIGKARAKKPKTGSSSHRRKDSSVGSLQAAGLVPPYADVKPAARAPSPHNNVNNANGRKRHKQSDSTVNGKVSRRSSPTEGKRGEESEVEHDGIQKAYKLEYEDITGKSDVYASNKVENYVKHLVDNPDGSVKRVTRDSMASLPRVAVRQLQALRGNSSLTTRHRLVLDVSCQKGKLVAIYKGEVGYKKDYQDDPYNQYSIAQHPKPHVLYHPLHDLYVDARKYGSDSRFARTSCRPTLTLHTMVVDGELMLGLFAADSLSRGTELTVPWLWDCSEETKRVVDHLDDEGSISPEDLYSAGQWVARLHEHVGDCCCNKPECKLTRITTLAASTPPPTMPNGKRKTKSASAGPSMGLFDGVGNGRINEHGAPVGEGPESKGELSKRDARKVKEYAAQFERMEQTESLQTPVKKRKRPNHAGLVPPTLENGKRRTSESAARSPLSIPNGRRVSDSLSVRSEVSRSVTPSVKRKRPVYVDSACQTDEDDALWWLKCPSTPSTPLPPPMSQKKRLLALLRERESPEVACDAAPESTPIPETSLRKRKSEDITDGVPSETSPRKEPRLGEDANVASLPNRVTPAESPVDASTPTPMEVDSAPASVADDKVPTADPSPITPKSEKGSTPPSEKPSPSLDAVIKQEPVADTSQHPPTPATPLPPSSTSTTGASSKPRMPSLAIELPPQPQFAQTPTATPTPGLPLHMQNAVTTPFSPVDGVATPSPRAKKVISLGDYTKRKSKVSRGKKDDCKETGTTAS